MLAKVSKPSPLAFMTKLSDSVYVYRPPGYDTSRLGSTGDEQPRLILMLGWMDARDAHLAKYLRDYQSLYPAACILLVKARFLAVLLRSVALQDVSAALPVIEDTLAPFDDNTPRLLIHVFSNGGSFQLAAIYEAWELQHKHEKGARLPTHVTIFDSAPSMHWQAERAFTATMMGVPRGIMYILFYPLVRLLALIWWFQLHILRIPDSMVLVAASHNDKDKAQEVRRVYIYSDRDALVDADHVGQHALEAQKNGFKVTKELFKNSAHVSHARTDPERYKNIIDRAWKGV